MSEDINTALQRQLDGAAAEREAGQRAIALLSRVRGVLEPFARIGTLINEYDEHRHKVGLKPSADKTDISPPASAFRAAASLLAEIEEME